MRTIGRVLTGLTVAMLVAAAIKVVHVITPASFIGLSSAEALGRLLRFADLTAVTATQQALFVLPLAVIAASVMEVNRARGLITSAVLGVVLAMAGFLVQWTGENAERTILNDYALRAYMIEGFFAGIAYWLVAGRFAGWRRGGALVRARPFPVASRRGSLNEIEDAEIEITQGRSGR